MVSKTAQLLAHARLDMPREQGTPVLRRDRITDQERESAAVFAMVRDIEPEVSNRKLHPRVTFRRSIGSP